MTIASTKSRARKKVHTRRDDALQSGNNIGARRLNWSLVGMMLGIKALIFTFGAVSYNVLTDRQAEGLSGWLKIWNNWDALHYVGLAENGYVVTGEARFALVFFPLYPWLMRLLAVVIGDYVLSAIAISTVASIAAGLLLYALVRLDHTAEIAYRAVFFLFIFPTSYFLHIGYTESLFIALALGSILAARTNHWLLAGALGALAGLTRINGLVLVPALAFEAFQQYRAMRRWQWKWLWTIVAAGGFVGYLLLNAHVTGSALTFMTMQREHYYKALAWPWTGIVAKVGSILTSSGPAEAQMIGWQEYLFVLIGLVSTIWCWLKLRPVYSIWMTGNLLLVVCNSLILSMPRYALIMFPIFILFARLAASRFWNGVIITWSLLYLALFAGQFVAGRWAF